MISYGRFHVVWFKERLSGEPAIGDIGHIPLDCRLYSAEMAVYLESYLKT